MDSQKRRRLIIQQAQRLQELKEGKDTSNQLTRRVNSKSRIYKTEHSLTVPRLMATQANYPQTDLDDLLQKGDCKLIFLQSNMEDIGFKTFTDMMRTNSSWLTQVPKLNQEQSSPNGQLKHRLNFNQAQAIKFKKQIDKKWNSTVQEVSESIIQKQLEQKPLQKIKIVQLKIQHSDHQSDDQEKEEEVLTPSVSQEIHINLKFFWFHVQISDWKPPIREGCTVTYMQNQNKCYMYGGIGNDLFKTFITLNTQTWAWKDIGTGTGDYPPEGRFGHSSTLYKAQIIIYGGEKKYNTAMKMRECYNDLRMFSPSDKNWLQIKTFGDIVEGRRNHIAQCVGKFFFIYGGINSYGRILNDVCGLNLETCKWSIFLVENYSTEGISDAASIPLFKGDVKMENPYFSYDCTKKKGKFPKVTTEGIYIFGGRQTNGEAVNDLRIIQFGTKPLKLTKAKTKGQPPLARYSHSMNYYQQLNALIIYGGRNDSRQGNILNDIFVLQVEQLNWVQVQQVGQLKHGKSSHCSVSIDSKILIFGGYTQNVYANADVQLIELDQNKVAKMVKDNKNNKNKEIIISSHDLISNTNLKVFKTEYYNEAEDPEIRQKKILENEVQKLAYNNFRSFMPLPPAKTSHLVQEYKLKREQIKLDTLKHSSVDLSRRVSRKTISDVKPIEFSRMQSKIE